MILCLCSCPFQYVVAAVLFFAGVTLNSTAEAQCCVARNTKEQTLANCTALIKSGRESGHNLAEDYHDRGDAYSHLKDYDRAIGDFGEALRIDPGNASIVIDRTLLPTSVKRSNSIPNMPARITVAAGIARLRDTIWRGHSTTAMRRPPSPHRC
jgi:tetratricopeptide (TPR) repeat protein